MSVPANTYQTYPQTNIREDLSNLIFNVDPYKTPLLNMSKKNKATQGNHEWDTDQLAAQNLNNAQVEGDDPAAQSLTPTARMGNYVQTSNKVVQLSGKSQAVIAAGGSNKMGYQLMKKSKELKRDMEGILTYNSAKNAGSSAVASTMGGLPCWLMTNTVFQTGGSPSGANPTAAANGWTDGSQTRTYNSVTTTVTEAQVITVLQEIFTSSGESPEYALVSPKNKTNISKFAGPGTRFIEVEDKVLKTAVDVYESDFGDVKIVPDIFLAHSGDIFFINPNYIRVAYLRPFQTVPLAKTGDSDKKMLLVDYTLEVGNEHAHGAIYDTNG
ncbi:Phage head protein [Pararobbsia alpina]|uniref:SU10 major capsid protein n=1 Tax=Pararobbsia alpina TaxID=621374 RepID=UPI0039A5D850